EAKTLRKLRGVALKSRIHVHSVRKVPGVPHHVIGNPKTIDQSLPVAQCSHANLSLPLNDLSASFHNPTLIFRVRVHSAERRGSGAGAAPFSPATAPVACIRLVRPITVQVIRRTSAGFQQATDAG